MRIWMQSFVSIQPRTSVEKSDVSWPIRERRRARASREAREARELRALRRGAVAVDGPGLYPGGHRVEVVAFFSGSGAIVVLGGAEVVLDVERRIACVDATSQGVADVRCGPVDAAATYLVHVICDHSLISVIVSNTTAITAVARPDETASTDVRLSGALVSADIYALAAAS